MTKKRSIRAVPNIPEDQLIAKIKGVPDAQMRNYLAFIYLFGNRVSEVIGLPKYTVTGHYSYTRTNKRGTKTVKIRKIVLDRDEKGQLQWEVEPVKAWQIEYNHITKVLYCRNVPTFKREGRPPRDVWILVTGPDEQELCRMLYEYVKTVKAIDEMDVLFNLTRNQVYKASRRYLGANAFPHKLRDLRATKDATVYGLDAKDLQEKYDWSRPDMAMYYGRKNRTDIIQKMQRGSVQYQEQRRENS